MCMIGFKCVGAEFDDALLTAAADANPHGYGIMFAKDGELRVHRSMDMTTILAAAKQIPVDAPAAVHCRIATHGTKDKSNCHPFRVIDGLYLMHNGILPLKDPKDEWSDTKLFAMHLRNILERDPSLFMSESFRIMVRMAIEAGYASNKLLFLRADGEAWIVNYDAGYEYGKDSGVWISSNPFPSRAYSGSGTTGYQYKSPAGSYENGKWTPAASTTTAPKADAPAEAATESTATATSDAASSENVETSDAVNDSCTTAGEGGDDGPVSMTAVIGNDGEPTGDFVTEDGEIISSEDINEYLATDEGNIIPFVSKHDRETLNRSIGPWRRVPFLNLEERLSTTTTSSAGPSDGELSDKYLMETICGILLCPLSCSDLHSLADIGYALSRLVEQDLISDDERETALRLWVEFHEEFAETYGADSETIDYEYAHLDDWLTAQGYKTAEEYIAEMNKKYGTVTDVVMPSGGA